MNIEDIEIGKEYVVTEDRPLGTGLSKGDVVKVVGISIYAEIVRLFDDAEPDSPWEVRPEHLRPKTLDDCTPEEWNKAGVSVMQGDNSSTLYPQDQQSLEAYCETIPDDGETEEELTGWSSGYYELPEGAKELQDLIEAKNMNFAIGNIFKACYRLGNKRGTSTIYDLKKILWYVQRELARLGEDDD